MTLKHMESFLLFLTLGVVHWNPLAPSLDKILFMVPTIFVTFLASLVAQLVKNQPAIQETRVRLLGGQGDGYPLQYSCLENSMNRGAWQARVNTTERQQACQRSFSS